MSMNGAWMVRGWCMMGVHVCYMLGKRTRLFTLALTYDIAYTMVRAYWHVARGACIVCAWHVCMFAWCVRGVCMAPLHGVYLWYIASPLGLELARVPPALALRQLCALRTAQPVHRRGRRVGG